MSRWLSATILLLQLGGCSQTGAYWVTIRFPDDPALLSTRALRVVAINPEDGAGCTELVDGTAQPGGVGYEVEDEALLTLPLLVTAPPLKAVGPGRRLFFAEARNAGGVIVLRGCTAVQAGGEGNHEVAVALAWVLTSCQVQGECDDKLWCDGEEQCLHGRCFPGARDCSDGDPCTKDLCDEEQNACIHPPLDQPPQPEGPFGAPSCSDGVDNDCDGLTDVKDPQCVRCTDNVECEDHNPCTDDRCDPNAGCLNTPNTAACDDGIPCTTGHICGNGTCRGAPDKSLCDDGNECTDHICDPAAGGCLNLPLNGKICDDGKFCTELDMCFLGMCVGGSRNCADEDECTRDFCNEVARVCDHVAPLPEGPRGDPSCMNGLDDDCDGTRDQEDPDCAIQQGFCNQDNWCWMNPLPQGNCLNAVWVIAENDLWAVGDGGTIMHWDGAAWASIASGTTSDLQDLWVADTNNIWVVAYGVTGLYHLRRELPSNPWVVEPIADARYLYGIWGSSPTAIWAVGLGGKIYRWDGVAPNWVIVDSKTTETLLTVWGSSAGDVWAGGERGTILHWTGAGWLPTATETAEKIDGIWGTGPDDIWAVGGRGTILRWTGSGWSPPMDSGTAYALNAVWGGPSGEVWAVGGAGTVLRWTGTQWLIEDVGAKTSFRHVHGTNLNDDVWLVGDSGNILRRENGAWSRLTSGAMTWFGGVWGAAENDVWIVGDAGTILHWNGSNLSQVESPVRNFLDAVWGSSATDVWAVGQAGVILHLDGSGTWSWKEGRNEEELVDVFGTGPDDVWAVGGRAGPAIEDNLSTVRRYRGGVWTTLPSDAIPHLLSGVLATPGIAWVAGDAGAIWRFEGNNWFPETSNSTHRLRAVWGSARDDLWAVGNAGGGGCLLRRNSDASWSVDPQENANLTALWGTGSNDIWAAGLRGAIRHWETDAWSELASGTTQYFWGIWSSNNGEVWAVGEGGAVLHLDPRLTFASPNRRMTPRPIRPRVESKAGVNQLFTLPMKDLR